MSIFSLENSNIIWCCARITVSLQRKQTLPDMEENKKQFDVFSWLKPLIISIIGTSIGVGLSFTVNRLVESHKQQKAQRETAIMAVYDIDEINRQMAVILRNIKDPRMSGCLVSVTAVDCKQDLRFCKIYYSVINYDKKLDDKAKDEEVKKALASASGFIRSELARSINLRVTPELEFVRDISLERGAAVSKVMKKIEEESSAAEDGDD